MRVLIVDDDQMICNGTARRLENAALPTLTTFAAPTPARMR